MAHVPYRRTIIFMAAAALLGTMALAQPARAGDVPTFAVDATWPKPLPNHWIIGQVGGITADSKDHIWVIHRPRSLTDDEKGASLNPPRSKCCISAPPVLEFDADGNLLRSWGGPGEGYEWVGREHGIEVDDKGNVWLTGNADNDNVVMKFTGDGKFVMQIGKIGPTKGSNDTTQLGKPAETTVDSAANEIYVADGYVNHRVIVFDATTGAYKRHWGAYGKPPDDGFFTRAGERLPGPFSGAGQSRSGGGPRRKPGKASTTRTALPRRSSASSTPSAFPATAWSTSAIAP